MTTRPAANPTISPVELSYLISVHSPRRPDPCRVCGGTEMSIAMMGSGTTRYVCDAAAEQLRSGGDQATSAHYLQSEQTIGYHGDERVAGALRELRALRERAGDDMTVPAGARHFPNGHGKNICWRFFTHRGNDQWVEEVDFPYDHDPAHATMKPAP